MSEHPPPPAEPAGTARQAGNSTPAPSGQPEHGTPAGPPAGSRPRRVAVAAALTAGQGAVIAALGLYMLVLLFTSTPDGVLQAVTGALTVLVLSVLPLSAARGLWLLRRWSRGPAVALQVFALPTGWQMIVSGGPWVAAGLALGAVALTVLACLASPTAARALGIGPRAA